MNLSDLAYGREAADILGVELPENVWRVVARHGAAYPGTIQVVEIGRAKAARRDELAGFAAWYRANVRAARGNARRDNPKIEAAGEDMEGTEAVLAAAAGGEVAPGLDARRAALRSAIRFIREVREEVDGF